MGRIEVVIRHELPTGIPPAEGKPGKPGATAQVLVNIAKHGVQNRVGRVKQYTGVMEHTVDLRPRLTKETR